MPSFGGGCEGGLTFAVNAPRGRTFSVAVLALGGIVCVVGLSFAEEGQVVVVCSGEGAGAACQH
jgi:hypothetical protein